MVVNFGDHYLRQHVSPQFLHSGTHLSGRERALCLVRSEPEFNLAGELLDSPRAPCSPVFKHACFFEAVSH